jgi:hypothetical protein
MQAEVRQSVTAYRVVKTDTAEKPSEAEKEIDADLAEPSQNLFATTAEEKYATAEEKYAAELAKFKLELTEKQKEVLRDFVTLEKPAGKGLWAIKGIKEFKPSEPTSFLKNNSFPEICPSQPGVNMKIVERKIADGLPATPVIPVAVTKDGMIQLLDKHHTFVACMALGRPVKFALTGRAHGELHSGGARDERAAVPKDFGDFDLIAIEKVPWATTGFRLTESESSDLEGKRIKEPNWRQIVPWRKDAPHSVKEKVEACVKEFEFLSESVGITSVAEQLFSL